MRCRLVCPAGKRHSALRRVTRVPRPSRPQGDGRSAQLRARPAVANPQSQFPIPNPLLEGGALSGRPASRTPRAKRWWPGCASTSGRRSCSGDRLPAVVDVARAYPAQRGRATTTEWALDFGPLDQSARPGTGISSNVSDKFSWRMSACLAVSRRLPPARSPRSSLRSTPPPRAPRRQENSPDTKPGVRLTCRRQASTIEPQCGAC
jgi:hypothetical protein